MPQYFLGVATSKELFNKDTTESYWCVPASTGKGDVILLYCPRSASFARQGVFAQAVISDPPNDKNKDNNLCSGYGLGVTPLRHVPIKITKRFKPAVTAKDMKRDDVMMNVGFVRKNFQGTTFRLEESVFRRIVELATKKEKSGVLEVPKPSGTTSLAEWAKKNDKRKKT